MKLDTTRQIERFRGLEPVWQWILGATVFLLVFLIWAQVLEPTSTAWAETANRMETDHHVANHHLRSRTAQAHSI